MIGHGLAKDAFSRAIKEMITFQKIYKQLKSDIYQKKDETAGRMRAKNFNLLISWQQNQSIYENLFFERKAHYEEQPNRSEWYQNGPRACKKKLSRFGCGK